MLPNFQLALNYFSAGRKYLNWSFKRILFFCCSSNSLGWKTLVGLSLKKLFRASFCSLSTSQVSSWVFLWLRLVPAVTLPRSISYLHHLDKWKLQKCNSFFLCVCLASTARLSSLLLRHTGLSTCAPTPAHCRNTTSYSSVSQFLVERTRRGSFEQARPTLIGHREWMKCRKMRRKAVWCSDFLVISFADLGSRRY